MTDAELQAHMAASRKLFDERMARGECVFDGDPHWDAAMKGLAENAIAGAEAVLRRRRKYRARLERNRPDNSATGLANEVRLPSP